VYSVGNTRDVDMPNIRTKRQMVQECAVSILKQEPRGLRYSDLIRKVYDKLPSIPHNTIDTFISSLTIDLKDSVIKPARGVYRHAQYADAPVVIDKNGKTKTVKEEYFYAPFAEWLVNELEECTKAIAVGGNVFKDKWGTPDVVGVLEPRKSDIIKFETEIVSAEVKLDTGNLIAAFGQACSYRLFSHKSYIVVPASSPEDDLARLDALAGNLGIGLIFFDPTVPGDPKFQIRVRAEKHEPDMFYVNKYLKLVDGKLFD
jgi:hypothetical protein